jgi:O-succinylbenzoic acid--CoA ligase
VTSSSRAFPDWLSYRSGSTPDRIALLARGRTWSFADLDSSVTSAALRLGELGVRSGDRVATLLHNSAGAAMLVHAVMRVGATLVPLNVRASEAELAWQIEDCDPRLVIVDERTAGPAKLACRDRPRPAVGVLDEENAGIVRGDTGSAAVESELALRFAHDPDSVVAIIHTSGTTGRPKGAMLTFGNFWWSAIGSAMNMGIREDDRWLVCLPLFHVGGLSIVVRSVICGFATLIHDAFDPDDVNRSIDEDNVTIVSVVAVMLERMLDARQDRVYPTSLRCVLLGGGPASQSLLERCASIGIPVMQTYGLTETASQVATLPPDYALRKTGSVGRPIYPNSLRIVKEDGSHANPGEPGEILVRGPVVMAGYAGQPDATAQAIVGGWLRTGDIGRLDAEGNLYVVDRRDDLIITGGENVYPAEVETALLAHPMVLEAAVVGVDDREWGQRVAAIVRLERYSSTMSADRIEALSAHCRSRLAHYKAPTSIYIVTEPLPRTASGKLQRALARNLVKELAG